MRPNIEYRTQHVRGELGRGKPERCPRSWLISVRAASRGTDLAEACTIALDILRGHEGARLRHREMRKLAGRRLS